MPSTQVLTNRIPNGGFNRAALPQAAGEGNWFDLLNLRPLVGGLVQTAPFVAKYAMSLLAGESAATRIHYMDIVQAPGPTIEYLVVNESNARYVLPSNLTGSQTKIPCVLQTAVPNNSTANGFAVLSGINVSDFSSDGDVITVKITGTNTFQWKKNSGSFSSNITISTPAIGFGSNGLVINFFAITGFTTNDTWTWTREALLPYSGSEPTTKDFRYNPAVFQTDLYLGGVGRNVLRVRSGTITSVGYNRVYGKYVDVFCNHLIVGQFAQGVYDAVNGVVDGYNANTTPYTVGWSDLNEPDDFVPDEPNLNSEADSYLFPYNSYPDAVNYGITGIAQLYGTEYIYLPDAIYQMQYVGLPAVMQILPRFQGTGCYYHNSLVLAKRGHYFLGRDNVYFFNGLIPNPIGEPVRTKLYAELPNIGGSFFDQIFGYYNVDEQEVIWQYWTPVVISGTTYYQCRQCIYMEKYSRFYFRNVPCTSSGATEIMTMCRVYQSGVLPRQQQYGGKGEVYFDYNSNETYANISTDLVGPTPGYTQPYAETNDLFYNSLVYKKDGTNLFIDATGDIGNVTSIVGSGSGRNFLSSAVSYTALVAINTANPEQGVVPVRGPLTGFRIYRYNFSWQNTGGPVTGAILNAWSDGYYGLNKQIER